MNLKLVRYIRQGLLLALTLLPPLTWAEADGPDFFRIRADQSVTLRAKPQASADEVARMPAGADCLRNLGCVGGLSLKESTDLPADAPARREAASRRWCQVSGAQGTGWLVAQDLAESGCRSLPLADQQVFAVDVEAARAGTVLNGAIRGRQFVDYALEMGAGQRLVATLSGSHGQLYFNVLLDGKEAALFVGSMSGSRFSRQVPLAGRYVLRVYLMRAAARRMEKSTYRIDLKVSGNAYQPLSPTDDALLPGTPYHASGVVPCRFGERVSCEAFVTRWGHDGTATVMVRWPQDAWALGQHLLFVRGTPVSSDGSAPFTSERRGDWVRVEFEGGGVVEIPHALVSGG